MPISYHQAISEILKIVEVESPNSILDIGIGFGKYGFLCRELLELPFGRYHKHEWKVVIDGIEAFKEYHNPIYDYAYDNIYYGDVLDIIDRLGSYDVVLLIDVLEHFTKDEGIDLIKKILFHTNKCLIVSTPIYPSDQKEYLGNRFEEHKSRWSLVDFKDFDFTYRELPIGENGAHIFKFYPQHIPSNICSSELKNDDDLFVSLDQIPPIPCLNVTYVLPHQNLTGGLKMLLEQMKQLKKRGHSIQVVYRGEGEENVLPSWAQLSVDSEILVPHEKSYIDYIKNTDIIVAGWVDQLKELQNPNVPVFYWEQGHGYLFGDFPIRDFDWNEELAIRNHLKELYTQNVSIVSVSKYVADVLYAKYGVRTKILPNYIDTNFYYPSTNIQDDGEVTILLVGNPLLNFKGFKVALHALELVSRTGANFRVKWVSPVSFEYKKLSERVSYPIEVIINPSQEELAAIYREASIHLFTSWYEGFGMPPLEAMASGVSVVATRCGGIETYAVHGKNALLFEPGDYRGIATGVLYLIKNPDFRRNLAYEGRKTALNYSFDSGIKLLEYYLFTSIKNFSR
jgi:glycosyltransferase involved in cell wall biosynthesis